MTTNDGTAQQEVRDMPLPRRPTTATPEQQAATQARFRADDLARARRESAVWADIARRGDAGATSDLRLAAHQATGRGDTEMAAIFQSAIDSI